MVDATLIKDTITELLEANVDKETIYQTLKDIGVDSADIDKYYREATTKEKAKQTETKTPEPETETPDVSENSKTEEAIHHKPKVTTEDLEKVTKEVIDLEVMKNQEDIEDNIIIEKDNAQILEINNTILEIKKQVSGLETQISDIKAQISGLTKIMKDILEENRNILNKLK